MKSLIFACLISFLAVNALPTEPANQQEHGEGISTKSAYDLHANENADDGSDDDDLDEDFEDELDSINLDLQERSLDGYDIYQLNGSSYAQPMDYDRTSQSTDAGHESATPDVVGQSIYNERYPYYDTENGRSSQEPGDSSRYQDGCKYNETYQAGSEPEHPDYDYGSAKTDDSISYGSSYDEQQTRNYPEQTQDYTENQYPDSSSSQPQAQGYDYDRYNYTQNQYPDSTSSQAQSYDAYPEQSPSYQDDRYNYTQNQYPESSNSQKQEYGSYSEMVQSHDYDRYNTTQIHYPESSSTQTQTYPEENQSYDYDRYKDAQTRYPENSSSQSQSYDSYPEHAQSYDYGRYKDAQTQYPENSSSQSQSYDSYPEHAQSYDYDRYKDAQTRYPESYSSQSQTYDSYPNQAQSYAYDRYNYTQNQYSTDSNPYAEQSQDHGYVRYNYTQSQSYSQSSQYSPESYNSDNESNPYHDYEQRKNSSDKESYPYAYEVSQYYEEKPVAIDHQSITYGNSVSERASEQNNSYYEYFYSKNYPRGDDTTTRKPVHEPKIVPETYYTVAYPDEQARDYDNRLMYRPEGSRDGDRYGGSQVSTTNSYERRMSQVDEYWREEERQKKMYESQNTYRKAEKSCTVDEYGRPINCELPTDGDTIVMQAPPEPIPLPPQIVETVGFGNETETTPPESQEEAAERAAFERANPVRLSPIRWAVRDIGRLGAYPRHRACRLQPVWGIGPEERSSWFYSQVDGRCLWFAYAGHNGNGNRFYSRANCETVCVYDKTDLCESARCTYPGSRCLLRGDDQCRINAKYRGKDIETECPPDQPVCKSRRAILPPEYDTSLIPQECNEPVEAGECLVKNPLIRFHYDPRSNTCRSFYFHGCGGNNNRFESMQECMNHCAL